MQSVDLSGSGIVFQGLSNAFAVTSQIDAVGNGVFVGSATSSQFRLSALNTAPSSASDTGTLGEIRIVADYIYVCVATNTWVRSALATW